MRKPFKLYQPGILVDDKPITDLKNNRNSKMIELLLRSDINGLFLYYLENSLIRTGLGFILPPGLTDFQSQQFKFEFQSLFERYAKLANKKGS